MMKKILTALGMNYIIASYTNIKTQCAQLKFWTYGKIKIYTSTILSENQSWNDLLYKYGFEEKKIVMNFKNMSFFSNFKEIIGAKGFSNYFYRLNMHKKPHLAKSIEDSIGQKLNIEDVNKAISSMGLTTSEELEFGGSKKFKIESGGEQQSIILSNTTTKPILGKTGEKALVGTGSIKDYIRGSLQWVTSYYGLDAPKKVLKKMSDIKLTSSEYHKQYKVLADEDIELIQQMKFFGSGKLILWISKHDDAKYSFSMVPKQDFYRKLRAGGCDKAYIDKLKGIDAEYDHLTKYGIDVPTNQFIYFNILEGGDKDWAKIIIDLGGKSFTPELVILKVKPGCEFSAIEAMIAKLSAGALI